MSQEIAPTLYIRLRKHITIARGDPIFLGQIAEMFLETGEEERLRRIQLYDPAERDGNFILMDMMLISKKIKEAMPRLTIELYGEPHTLVEMVKRRRRKPNLALLCLVWLLLFIGSGLAIMNFHADVSMLEVHKKMYKLITGREDAHPLILQIPYSLGIGAGMVVFFNRIFKKKFNEEPTPLEVEMYMYQESLNQYVITDEYAKLNRRHDRDSALPRRRRPSGDRP